MNMQVTGGDGMDRSAKTIARLSSGGLSSARVENERVVQTV
jgi:hypothetical protein